MIKQYVELIKTKTNLIAESILEIGSRDGHDANFFKESFNICPRNVFIVEPNPSQAKKIKETYAEYNLFEVAIFNESKEMDFYEVYDEHIDPIGISSLKQRNDDWYERFKTRKIKVSAITGKELLDKIASPIQICKVDVEGATYEVLESLGENIKLIDSFHLETERAQFWKDQKLHEDICEYMKSKGYVILWSDDAYPQTDTIWIKPEYII